MSAVAHLAGELEMDDLRDHLLGLVLLTAALQYPQLRAGTQLAPEPLFEDMGVVADQLVGGLEDAAAGTVVLFQLDHLQAGEVALQAHQVLGAGAAPGIDRLIVVPHHREGGAHPHQQLDQFVLGLVGVLVLVDQQIAHLVLPLLQGVRVVPEEVDRQQDQVVEVHCVVGLEAALVGGVEQGRVGLQIVFRVGQSLLWTDQIVFPGGDLPLGGLHHRLVAAVLLAQQILHEGGRVLLIEDGEARFVAEPFQFPPQDVQSQGVKGRDHRAVALVASQQGRHAGLHLPRRLVGEGDGGDVSGFDAAAFRQIADLGGDHPGLAAARAGQHQQGAVDVMHRFTLARVEIGHAGCRFHGREERRKVTQRRGVFQPGTGVVVRFDNGSISDSTVGCGLPHRLP